MSEWYEQLEDAVSVGAPSEEKEMGNKEFAYNIVRAIGQGALFGFADEAEAYARSVLSDEGYEDALKDARASLGKFREENVALSTALEIGGSLGYGVAGVGTKALIKAAGYGGLYGAGASEEGERMKGAIAGGLTAGGLQKVSPKVTEGAAELLSKGVPVPVGQAFGGASKKVEEGLTSLPFVGDVIQSAQRRAIEKFGAASFNEALAPIGKKVPMKLTGREAYKKADDIISKEYDDIIERIEVPLDEDFLSLVNSITKRYVDDLPSDYAKVLVSNLQNTIFRKAKDGVLSKDNFKSAQSVLRNKAYDFTTGSDPIAKEVGEAFYNVLFEVNSALARKSPNIASRLAKVDEAYSRFIPLQKASAKAKEGVFTPANLMSQIRSEGSRSKSALARGERPMQAFAESAESVIGSKLGDSQTAYRTILGMGALGGLGAGVGAPLGLMGAGAAAGGLYTRPMQAGLRYAIPRLSKGVRTPAAAGMLSQSLLDAFSPQQDADYITPTGSILGQ